MTPLRWGILSTAQIGTNWLIPALHAAANAEVVAIASRDPDRAGTAAGRLGIPTAYGSYEELLGDESVDVVYVPLPNHLHMEWTLAAAQAGKHVLCEKPLALRAEEARQMVAACEEAGVVLMEAFMYRLHPSWTRAMRIIDSGQLGAVHAVHSWFSYYNDDPDNIRNVLEFGGGALMDVGCYLVNLSRLIFGSEPDVVQADMQRDSRTGVDTTTSAILRFGDGTASFTCSTRIEPAQWVSVFGAEGRLDIEVPFNMAADRPTRLRLTRGGEVPGGEAEVIEIPPAGAYQVQVEEFSAAVLAGGPAPTSPEDAIENMQVIEAVAAAAERVAQP